MKHLKLFENLDKPQVGDYVIVKSESSNKKMKNYIETHVGRICEDLGGQDYKIKYDGNEFINFMNNIIVVYRHQIIHFSKDKEYLEMKLQANKYNI